jgi:hypothetical protein
LAFAAMPNPERGPAFNPTAEKTFVVRAKLTQQSADMIHDSGDGTRQKARG